MKVLVLAVLATVFASPVFGQVALFEACIDNCVIVNSSEPCSSAATNLKSSLDCLHDCYGENPENHTGDPVSCINDDYSCTKSQLCVGKFAQVITGNASADANSEFEVGMSCKVTCSSLLTPPPKDNDNGALSYDFTSKSMLILSAMVLVNLVVG